jgi:hypothetical protein
MLDKRVLKIEERHVGHRSFLPQDMVWREVWIGVFRKSTFTNDDLHIERCS